MELIAGFSLLQIAVALTATFAAAFVRGLAGFGMAILMVPVLALALTPVEAVLVTNFVALFLGLTEMRWILRKPNDPPGHLARWCCCRPHRG